MRLIAEVKIAYRVRRNILRTQYYRSSPFLHQQALKPIDWTIVTRSERVMKAPYVDKFAHDGCPVVVADSRDIVLPTVTSPGDKVRAGDRLSIQPVRPQV